MKTRNIMAALLLMVAGLQTARAQGFRVYKSDGTVAQFSLRTDSIVFYDDLGSDVDFGPFTPVNQMIVGTWYKSKTETVTFREDGTTDYIDGATYEFMPYQGTVIIYNASGAPINILKVYKVTTESMIVRTNFDSDLSVWYSTSPVQLVTSIVLSDTSTILQPDESKRLTATILPSDADNKEVSWESSNEAVAEVNNSGRITANANGICTITCSAKDGSGVKAECQVTVGKSVTSITLSQTSLSLEPEKTQTLTATVLPSDATNKQITWSSNNITVAKVLQSGKVTAVAAGTCTITCSAKDGSGVKAECQVTVVQPVTSITLSQTSLSLETGKTQTLTATVLPTNATNKSVTWSSNKTNVAIVDQTGKVTAVAGGTCTVTCITKDGSGVKATCSVTVNDPTHGYTNGHEWVDLGLPSGTLWATCNVGANSLDGYGNYYAWGETAPKGEYNWNTYWDTPHSGNQGYYFYTYFVSTSNHTGGRSELLSAHDAATANWGDGWQMPRVTQFQELINSGYTTTEWTTLNNTNGLKITSKSNDNSIFLPAAGNRNGTSLIDVGEYGGYWSRSLTSDDRYAFTLYFNYPENSSNDTKYILRSCGLSVRPVRKQ